MRTSSQNTPERRAVERLDALAAEHGLDASQRGQLMRLLSVLARDPHAPTAVRVPEDARRRPRRRLAQRPDARHGARGPHASPTSAPARVCRAWFSRLRSHGRGLAGRERSAQVRLHRGRRGGDRRSTNARFVCARAEDWREGAGACDVVLARALAPQPVVLEYAAPLLRIGGSLVDWRGSRVRADEEAAAARGGRGGAAPAAILAVRPFPAARDHHLHVFEKIARYAARASRGARGSRASVPLGA